MTNSNATKHRKNLENKMAKIFAAEIASFSPEFREILVDDMVSAFEGRLLILSRAQSNSDFLNVIEEEIHIEAQ
jgi:hypothetical protein